MSKDESAGEVLEELVNKIDDFYWLIKAIQGSGYDELDTDQIYGAMNCLLRLISDIRSNAVKLLNHVL